MTYSKNISVVLHEFLESVKNFAKNDKTDSYKIIQLDILSLTVSKDF